MDHAVTATLTDEQQSQYQRDGYIIVKGLFNKAEVESFLQHFMAMHASGTIPNYPVYSKEEAAADPLKQYPRIMHPHRFDELSRQWLLDSRIANVLRDLMGQEPVATQSMLYFKPPRARGQAFHQDNFYLRVRPMTCVAAWVALDRSDPENGGLSVCPGTHTMNVVCPEKADIAISFSTELVPPPAGTTPVPAILDPGDVLFFNGSVVHGSTPNSSATRWRRSFICHYAPVSMKEVSHYYFPVLDMDGRELSYSAADGGGPCGTVASEAH